MNDPNTEKQGPSVPNKLKSIEEAFLSGAISNNNGDFPNNNTKGGEEEFIERISSNDDFLRLLRADGNFEEQNADTLPTGNGEHHKQKRSSTTASPGGGGGGGDGGGADLFLLFDPPPPVVVAPKNNDYLSNNSSSGLLPPPILNLPTTTTTTTTKSSSPTKILRRPLPIDRRKRSVSFDTRTNPIIPAMDHLRQPNLEEPSSETTPTISVKVDTDHHHHDDRKLTIDDLLGSGPYELEAQTHILKALEEHQETQTNISPGHYRYRSETSTIFSGVPENVVHDFSLKDDCNDDDALKGQDSMGGGSAGDHGDRPGVIEQTKPLLKRVASSQQRYHRRTMTVEDRLAGLTFAMQNLGDDEGMGSENNNIMLETLNEGTAVEHLSHTAALITGNIDVHNAGSLSPKPRPRLATAGSVASLFRKSPGVDGSLSPRPRPRLATAGSVASIFRKSSGDNDHSSLDAPSGDMEEQLPPQGEPPISSAPTNQKKSRVSRVSNNIFTDRLKEEWDTWKSFFSPRRQHVRKYIRSVIFYLLVPLVGVAAILFYCGGNPRTGKSSGDDAGERASVSWWLLFAVRQVITFSLALALQSIIIDFFCIGTRVMLRILGPLLTLLLAQSKGWPFVVFWWAVFDFAMLCGDLPFAQHWGYWQDYVALFNETNPSGQVVYSVWNYRVLTIAMIVSLAVSLKRFVIGLYLGRQTFGKQGSDFSLI